MDDADGKAAPKFTATAKAAKGVPDVAWETAEPKALTEFTVSASGRVVQAPWTVRVEAEGYEPAGFSVPMDALPERIVRPKRIVR